MKLSGSAFIISSYCAFAARENKRHVLARERDYYRARRLRVNADFRGVTGQADQFARAARKIMRHGLCARLTVIYRGRRSRFARSRRTRQSEPGP